MKIYISGAISNNANYKEQFAAAEQFFIAEGYEVINPAKNTGDSYKEYIDKGLMQEMECDAICLLPGWENSKGAKLEFAYASTVGQSIFFY